MSISVTTRDAGYKQWYAHESVSIPISICGCADCAEVLPEPEPAGGVSRRHHVLLCILALTIDGKQPVPVSLVFTRNCFEINDSFPSNIYPPPPILLSPSLAAPMAIRNSSFLSSASIPEILSCIKKFLTSHCLWVISISLIDREALGPFCSRKMTAPRSRRRCVSCISQKSLDIIPSSTSTNLHTYVDVGHILSPAGQWRRWVAFWKALELLYRLGVSPAWLYDFSFIESVKNRSSFSSDFEQNAIWQQLESSVGSESIITIITMKI